MKKEVGDSLYDDPEHLRLAKAWLRKKDAILLYNLDPKIKKYLYDEEFYLRDIVREYSKEELLLMLMI